MAVLLACAPSRRTAADPLNSDAGGGRARRASTALLGGSLLGAGSPRRRSAPVPPHAGGGRHPVRAWCSSATASATASAWGSGGRSGYALGADAGAGNFTYSQILTHYYGNTTLQTLGTAPAPAVHPRRQRDRGHDGEQRRRPDRHRRLGHRDGRRASPAPAPAVFFHLVGPGSTYDVYTGGGLCRPGGGTLARHRRHRAHRGGHQRRARSSCASPGPASRCTDRSPRWPTPPGRPGRSTPSRSSSTWPTWRRRSRPSTWAALGGAGPQGQNWGFQQSEAQTVAARSYVEANPLGYGGYADTCDQTCQSYPGMKYETATSMLAAQDTAGQVMVTNGTSTVATTEYSASSGGYSAGAQFPAVVDAGRRRVHQRLGLQPESRLDGDALRRLDRRRLPVDRRVHLAGRDVAQRRLGDFGGRVNAADRDRHRRLGVGHRLRVRRRLQSEVHWFSLGRPTQRRGRRATGWMTPRAASSRFGERHRSTAARATSR